MGDTITKIIAGIILIVVLAGLFALVWHGSITGNEALAVVVTIVGAVVGAFAHSAGVQAGARATNQDGGL